MIKQVKFITGNEFKIAGKLEAFINREDVIINEKIPFATPDLLTGNIIYSFALFYNLKPYRMTVMQFLNDFELLLSRRLYNIFLGYTKDTHYSKATIYLDEITVENLKRARNFGKFSLKQLRELLIRFPQLGILES